MAAEAVAVPSSVDGGDDTSAYDLMFGDLDTTDGLFVGPGGTETVRRAVETVAKGTDPVVEDEEDVALAGVASDVCRGGAWWRIMLRWRSLGAWRLGGDICFALGEERIHLYMSVQGPIGEGQRTAQCMTDALM